MKMRGKAFNHVAFAHEPALVRVEITESHGFREIGFFLQRFCSNAEKF